MQFASRVETTAVNCGQTPQYPRDTISDTRTSYDTRSDGTPQPNGTPPTKGDITLAEEIDHYDGATPQYRTVATTAYDVHGRATAITDADGNTTKSTYTPATGGPVTQLVLTNALNQKTTRVYEPAWGTPRTVTDLNSWVTETTYDALGRTAEVWAPNRLRSSHPQGTARFAYDIRNDKPSAVSTTRVGPNGNFTTSTTILDSLYRTRQVQTPAPGGGRLMVDTRYDSHGRTFKTTQPFYNDQPVDTDLWVADDTEIPGFTTTEFDGADRPVAAIYKTDANERWRTTTTYGGDRISVTPPGGGTPTTTITDARGHTRNLRQYHGAEPTGDYDETTYTYTPAGQLAGLTDSSGNHWSYGYDLHGSLNQAVDPDRGTMTYTYDKLNQLATSTDARNVTLAYSYDHLGRKTGLYQGSTTGPKLAEWAFDTAYKGVGQPASSTRWVNGNAYVKKVYAYSPLGQPAILGTIIPDSEGTQLAGTYVTNTTYAEDGTLGGASIPKAGDLPVESMLYVHDDLGNALTTSGGLNNGTQEYVTASDYTKYGELQRLQLGVTGHRAWLSALYDKNTRRLDRTVVDAELSHVMQADNHYTYNPAGAITSIANTPLDQAADTQCFRYDYLQRLTEAWTPASEPCSTDPATSGLGGPARYWQSFTYDKSGNRTTDTQHNASGDVTRRYTYDAPGNPKPHVLNSVTSSGAPGTTQFTYDNVGNTKTRPGATAQQTLDWDTESRLSTVTEGSSQTSFLYDADGGRLIRRDPTGTTLYLGDQEVRVDKQSGMAKTSRYYSHGGAVVAVRSGGKLSWLAGDHQGTTQIAINVTDDTTEPKVQQRRQTPFGTPRGTNGELPGERGFVGGTVDQGTGLTHLGARDYDADLGRFVSLDPILNPADPQQINGYSYANNSPLSFSDPSGLILQMDGRPAWIGQDAIASMSPAKAARARNYNAGVKTNWASAGARPARRPSSPTKKQLEDKEWPYQSADAKRLGPSGGRLELFVDAYASGGELGAMQEAYTQCQLDSLSSYDCASLYQSYGLYLNRLLGCPNKNACLLIDGLEVGIAAIGSKNSLGAAGGVAGEFAEARAATIRAEQVAGRIETARVGRWMSVGEFDGMLKTGTVQAGAGGRAYVVHPSDSSSFGSQAAPGSLYVEFDVPRSSLQQGGRSDWYQISGPDSLYGRLAARRGETVPQLPPATNIQVMARK